MIRFTLTLQFLVTTRLSFSVALDRGCCYIERVELVQIGASQYVVCGRANSGLTLLMSKCGMDDVDISDRQKQTRERRIK